MANLSPFINPEGSSFDFAELEEAIDLQGVELQNDEPKSPRNSFDSYPTLFQFCTNFIADFVSGRPAATLDIFPSWPITTTPCSSYHHSKTEPSSHHNQSQRKGANSTSQRPLDAKTLRRLAQNREAAKKSRLRKKAYIQQLESSRIKLSQLEQDLHRARSEGLFLGAFGGVMGGNISSGAAIFDMEYARWLDDDHRMMSELRVAVEGHLPDGDLRAIVDGYMSHYDEIFELKSVGAKSDVFHLMTGMWMSPAERCFLWIGGFRPSKLIEMVIPQLETLTEQQAVGICNLQRCSQETEDALYQGLDQLHNSLIITVAGTAVMEGVNHMAVAAGKLSNLEGFIRQADMLRQQTLHQLRRILTVRQAARCFVVIGEYYGRLRALSSLWVSRPRESRRWLNEESSCQTATRRTEEEMIQIQIQSSHNHFPNF